MRRGYPVGVHQLAVFSAPVVVAERLAVVAVRLPVDGRMSAPTLQWFACNFKYGAGAGGDSDTSAEGIGLPCLPLSLRPAVLAKVRACYGDGVT